MQNWVVFFRFDDGRCLCWGQPPWCTFSDWADGKGLGRGLLGMCAAGIIGTLGGNTVEVSLGTLGEGARKSGWNTTAGEGRGALRAGAARGLAVTLEKMWDSVWMAAN